MRCGQTKLTFSPQDSQKKVIMQANHGPQGHFGFADEQADNVNGVYPATPVQNNYSTTMRQPITYGNAQTQQGRLRGQPQFIGQQQVVNFNDNLYTLPMRNHPGVTMNFAPGNTQLAQQIPQSQPRFINQQMINAGGWTPEVVVFGNNPYTMDATTELHHSNGQQPDQFLNTQNDQPAQIYQSDEEYQHGQNYHHCQDQQQYGQNQQRRQNYQRVQSYHNSPGSNNSLNNQNCARNPVAHCYQPVTGLPPQAARAGNHPRSGICSQARQATTAPQAATNPTRATTNPPRAATASRSTTNAPQVATTPQSAIHPQAANPTQSAISTQARLPLNTGSLTASAPQVRSAESHESSLGTEATERFEDEVKRLIEEKATTFKAHIKSHNEVAQYKQAVWKARLSGGNHEKKCGDYPKDAAGELEIIQRIFDAIVNVDGEQDPASETGDFANCLAVKIIKGLSTIDVELLAHDFLVSTATLFHSL